MFYIRKIQNCVYSVHKCITSYLFLPLSWQAMLYDLLARKRELNPHSFLSQLTCIVFQQCNHIDVVNLCLAFLVFVCVVIQLTLRSVVHYPWQAMGGWLGGKGSQVQRCSEATERVHVCVSFCARWCQRDREVIVKSLLQFWCQSQPTAKAGE